MNDRTEPIEVSEDAFLDNECYASRMSVCDPRREEACFFGFDPCLVLLAVSWDSRSPFPYPECFIPAVRSVIDVDVAASGMHLTMQPTRMETTR